MAEPQIRFNDGAGYERLMGVWSRRAGDIFLDWLAPPSGWRWLDVGCGNGAFTELVCERCAPAAIDGIDPSEGQLGFARTRPGARLARFRQGDAMALPFPENGFDAAVMALVIFFVPDPARGVAEMARVVRPGGTVAAYVWDQPGGGSPLAPISTELRAMGYQPPRPPSADVSRVEALREVWTGAGLEAVETRAIAVTRTFADFDDFWSACAAGGGPTAPILAAMSADENARLKARVSARLPPDAAGHIIASGHANAVKGRVPG